MAKEKTEEFKLQNSSFDSKFLCVKTSRISGIPRHRHELSLESIPFKGRIQAINCEIDVNLFIHAYMFEKLLNPLYERVTQTLNEKLT